MGTSRGEHHHQPNRFKFEQQQLQEEEGSLLPRKPQGGGAPTSCLNLFYPPLPPRPPRALLAFLSPLCRAECPLFPISFFCFSTEEAGFWQNSFQKGIGFGRASFFLSRPMSSAILSLAFFLFIHELCRTSAQLFLSIHQVCNPQRRAFFSL
jgi:hypothetical protein